MAKTVALSGYMDGPTVTGGGGPADKEYDFVLTNPLDPNKKIKVNWRRDIWWIDTYPHPGGDEPGGDVAHHLGRRTIWLDATSPLINEFITGAIVDAYVPPGDNLEGWSGPVFMCIVPDAAGPQGTSYPPCICPKTVAS